MPSPTSPSLPLHCSSYHFSSTTRVRPSSELSQESYGSSRSGRVNYQPLRVRATVRASLVRVNVGGGGGGCLAWEVAAMEGRGRRGGGGGGAAGVGAGVLVWLVFFLQCGGAWGLNADGALLLSFKYVVTADPLGALDGWSDADESPCAWNGVMCNGFPQAAAVNVTLASAAGEEGNSTVAVSGLYGTASGVPLGTGVNASLAAATVSRVIGLVLPNAQLSGSLPADLGRLEHLRHIDLSGNSLNGSLPAALLNASELRVLSLAGNDISGGLPDGSAYTRSLQELNLSDNAVAGRLPAALCRLPSLAVLGLSNNYLAGGLPIGGLGALEVVDLSANYFNGNLPPDFGGSRLRFLNVSSNKLTGALPTDLSVVVPANATVDLSNNNFTGTIPQAGPFAVQPAAAYEGNPELCGPPLKHMCSIPSSLSNPPNATDSPPAFAAIPKNPALAPPGAGGQAPPPGQGKLRPVAILAIVAGDIAGVGILFMVFLYVYHIRRKRRQRREQDAAPPHQKGSRGIGGAKTLDTAGGKEDKASTSRGCCIGGGKNDSSDSSDCSASSSDAGSDDGEDLKKRGSFIGWSTPQHHSKKHEQQQATPAPATLVTVDGDGELEMETLLKASAYILGATGSSIVYKAVLADGTALAVRRIGESGGADKLKDFEAQVRAVARFRHPNILRLRGFYWGADEKLLIHEYAANGSLANVAFTRRFGASSPMHLSLEARLRIARGVARGLAYIHEKKGVHGNVKPSNILLGADMEPWIGDFGLDRLRSGEAVYRSTGASARLFGSKRSMHSTSSLPDLSQMPGGGGAGASPCASSSAAASASAATPPYQAPECLKNLRPNAKWDVYSFGMVLLELLSGRVYSEVELCQWHAGSTVAAGAGVAEDRGRVLRMADPTLRGEADGKEDVLLGCFKLAFACCAMAPGKRPAMRDAAMALERIHSSSSTSGAADHPSAAIP